MISASLVDAADDDEREMVRQGCAASETKGGSSLNTPLNTPKCSVRVFRVFMNTPPEYPEYSDYSTEYSA